MNNDKLNELFNLIEDYPKDEVIFFVDNDPESDYRYSEQKIVKVERTLVYRGNVEGYGVPGYIYTDEDELVDDIIGQVDIEREAAYAIAEKHMHWAIVVTMGA